MLYLGGVTQREFVFNIIEIDVHPQRFRQNAQLGTNVAVTNNPQFFATRFKRAGSQFVPHATVRLSVRFRHAAQQQQQFANYQFGNGAGVREWCVKHGDPAFCRRTQINLIGANTEATNRDQFLCGVNHLFSQMSTGSQANKMGITDGLFQLFSVQSAFVKLDVGVTCRTKAFQCFLMHTFNQQKLNLFFLQ